MNPPGNNGRLLLACYREGARTDARIAKAARAAEADPAVRPKLREQVAFDGAIVAAISSLRLPERLAQSLASSKAAMPAIRDHARHPAILCAIAGVLLGAGFLAWLGIEELRSFPGKENAVQMVEQLGKMTGGELEAAAGAAGTMADWFYMRGFDGFTLAPELAALPAMGRRTFKVSGHPVGQIALDSQASILNVFRAADFGVQLDPKGDWKVFACGEWVAAIRQREGICTLLAFRGTEAQMDEFVHSLKP
jgi:hypothetical protein